MPVNAIKAKEYVEDCMDARVVPMLKGAPGIGKSSIVKAIAAARNLLVIDVRLSQADPTDLNGFPTFENGKATYKPFDTFPVEGDKLPVNFDSLWEERSKAIAAGDLTKADITKHTDAYKAWYAMNVDKHRYAGWLLFLDEFSSAPPTVQAAAYKLVLDHEVGKHKMHPEVYKVCAGNRVCDNAIANNIGTAMLSRLIHIEMESDAELWDDWAAANGINHKIRDYIKFKPENINNFNPEQTEETFGCERTWEFAHKLMNRWNGTIPGEKLPLLQGTIGSGLATEFFNFLKVYKEIPTFQEICTNAHAKVPSTPDRIFAVCGVIAKEVDTQTIQPAMGFVGKLPLEFQVICMKDVIKTNPALSNHPDVNAWIKANMNSMF